MTKTKQLLLSILLAVGGFFLSQLIGATPFIVAAIVFWFLRKKAKTEKSYLRRHYAFIYSCIFSVYGLILFMADSGLADLNFDSFFSKLLLFSVSMILIAFLGMMIVKGAKAIINVGAWANNPGINFAYVAIGFLSLISVMRWISGVIEDGGIAGTLSILAFVFAFIPSEWLDLTGSGGGYVPQGNDGPRKIILEDGTELTEQNGKWKDERNHEWEKSVGGVERWEDKGYKP